MKTVLLIVADLGIVISSASAAVYECPVTTRFDGESTFTPEFLRKWQPSVRIVDSGEASRMSRCSFSTTEGKVTCDTYEVDHIAISGRYHIASGDKRVWHDEAIKKFYNFGANFDVQLYLDSAEALASGDRSGLLFVENNGRGTISYGTCNLVQ